MKPADIVKAARDRMSDAVTHDKDNREDALSDLKMLSGDHWPETEKTERENAGRPVITINRLPQFVRQVTGDIRKLNPAIKVLGEDDDADKEVAEVIEGLVRQIEYKSSATSIYEGAAESAAQCGMGAWRVRSDYESEDSFDQCLLIERIHNPFAVYWDPAAREATRSDANFCFITEQMTVDKFKKKYPGKATEGASHDGSTDGMENWSQAGQIVTAEYYWKEPREVTLYQLPDGSVAEEKPEQFVKSRKVTRNKVMWAKVSGRDVLEGPTEIPGKHIPVVAVMGEEMSVGDRIVRTSVIRFAKDPARVYNYAASTQTEVVALQPKAPFIGTQKQFAGLDRFWIKANTSNFPYLPYNPDEKAPGAPQRSTPPLASSGLAQEIARAADDMKATTGIYDAGLGNRSSETSGVAIRQRQMESDVSTSIYTDNLAKSIEHSGRIIVGMIPHVYDTDRIVRLISDDGQESTARINGQQPVLTDQGVAIVPINPLAIGKYDVRVTVGPNYSTRRQETAEGMIKFLQAIPAAGNIAPDLFAKAMDWPDAEKLADRFKRTMPPELLSPDEMPDDMKEALAAQQKAAQGEQEEQEQIQAALINAEVRTKQAEAGEAEAQAQEAAFDAVLKQIEVSAQSGAINAAIQDAVERAAFALTTGQMPQ